MAVDARETSGLNDNHRRSLLAAFKQIDRLMRDIETATASTASPFAGFFADLSPAQQQVIADYVAHSRAQMTDAVKALGIRLRPPDNPSSWAIQTNLSFAQIAVQEIDPSRLTGYGPLGPEAAALVARLNADLERGLRRLQAYLSQGLGKDLESRLDRLQQAPIDLALLRSLERVIREQGLIEFHGALEALLERLESRTFEIAVFGRISCGKSSLLNAVLGFDALPVGITPVTAVPTRVTWGDSPGAEIRFADAPSLEVPIERLPEFVSEGGNPENGKHVVRAVVRLPSPQLRRGVVFVDTPGVGSLAKAGARESYAYLPRCDLGILLIDAASTPSREDLDLLRLLYESGIPGRVVISKADLLSEPDRPRMRDYVRAQIGSNLGLDLPVQLVSTVGGAELARNWFSSEIAPLLDQAEDLAQASARRKLASLREGVAASLRASLSARQGKEGSGDSSRWEAVERVALEAETYLQEAEHKAERLTDQARTLAEPTLTVAASEIARHAASGSGPDTAREIVRQAIADTALSVRQQIQQAVLTARDGLRKLLREIARELDRGAPDAEELAVDLLTLPALEAPPEAEIVPVEWPRWAARFSKHLERRIHRDLSRQLGHALQRAYESFGRRLREWLRAALSRLAEQFAAQAEPLRAAARRLREGSSGKDPERIAADLLELENFDSSAVTVPTAQKLVESIE